MDRFFLPFSYRFHVVFNPSRAGVAWLPRLLASRQRLGMDCSFTVFNTFFRFRHVFNTFSAAVWGAAEDRIFVASKLARSSIVSSYRFYQFQRF